jgi:DNA (cytosine-5)-methyltransferase 1
VNDTLNVYDNGEARTPTLILENHPNDSRVKIREDGVCQTLNGRMGTGGGNTPMCMKNNENAVVRRLTPLECERLQGYPDGWTDIGEWADSKGKKHKEADSPRYKALGNSIALPYWEWLAKKVATSLGDSDLTMGSLFDGIGGFPLVFQRAGVRPIWASEIEEFPIAVTKLHFPENEDAKKR